MQSPEAPAAGTSRPRDDIVPTRYTKMFPRLDQKSRAPALSASYRFELLDDQRFGKPGVRPFLERRQSHHRLHVALHDGCHRNRIGAKAMHDRRKHGIRRTEGAEQKRPGFSVSLAALGPDLLNAVDIGATNSRQFDGSNRSVEVFSGH